MRARARVLVIAAAACLAAACSSPSSKPATSTPSATTTQAAVTSSSSSTDVNIGIMCSNLDGQIKDLTDLLDKLSSGQSVPTMGIGLPIAGAANAARTLVLDHPNAAIDPDLTAFAGTLDDLGKAVIASPVDQSVLVTSMGNVSQAWTTLSRHCGSLGGYAFSNRIG